MRVRLDRPSLPLLRAADALVVGGSFAGVVAALELARSGLRVLLVEPRTYLGREVTATLRLWARAEEPLPELVRACVEATGAPAVGGEYPLKPDAVKLALEDLLLGAGADLLYATLPVGVLAEDGNLSGLVVANKSSRQVLAGRLVLDATETAVVARVAGGTFAPGPETARYGRVLELDGVKAPVRGPLAVPSSLGLVDDVVTFHQGYRGQGHVLVECAMTLEAGTTVEAASRRETEARRRTMALAMHLLQSNPALDGAFLAAASYELSGPQTPPLAESASWPSGDLLGGEPRELLSVRSVDGRPVSLPLAAFAGPISGLWCVDSARLATAEADDLRDPLFASDLGAAIGSALAERQTSAVAAPSASVRPLDTEAPTSQAPGLSVRELESPQKGRRYEQREIPPAEVTVIRSSDVLVAGGGTSGATAAIVAAESGMRTVLLEMNPDLGGVGTLGGIDSYWYGRRIAYCARVMRLVAEVQRGLCYVETGAGGNEGRRWSVEAKMHALRREAARVGAEMLFNCQAFGAIVDGDRVRGVVAATRYGPVALLAEVTIDATGDGDVAAYAGAECVYGSARDHVAMYYSFSPAAKPGRMLNVKTSMVDVGNVEDYNRAILAGRRRGALGARGASQEAPHDHAIYLAARESRHVLGEVVVTLTDQLLQRCWPDVVNVHFSNHDVKGKSGAPWVNVGLIPPNLEMEIPYRALVPRRLDGLLIGGKAYSTTHDGLAGPRMQPDIENQGGVVALAAAQAVRRKIAPRQVDVGALQRDLVEVGLLPRDILERPLEPRAYSDVELANLVESLDASRPLHSYSDMGFDEVRREPIPFVEVCTAGPRVVPILEQTHDASSGPRRVLLAQALALHGSRTGVPTLVAEIERQLAGGTLPIRDPVIRHMGWPPDQGAMPDVAFLLYSLGLARDTRAVPIWERVAGLLDPQESDFRDRVKGTFYYVDAIAFGAERLADPAAIPALERLRAFSTIRDQVSRRGFQPDIFAERRALLELAVARALARCGDARGFDVLIGYLDDNRALLAEAAEDELSDISGQRFGKDAAKWRAWLSGATGALRPSPYSASLDLPAEGEVILRRARG